MKQFRVLRRIGTVPISDNGFATLDLPRDYDYESIFVRITGSVDVGTLATAVRAEAPCQAIKRLELIADGKNNLFSAPFWFACLGSYDRKALHNGARAITPPSGVAVATYAVEAFGSIDVMMLDGVRPKDSNFRSMGLSLLQLRLTFGAPGDMFVGGAATYNNLTAEIFVQQLVEGVGPNGEVTSPVLLKKVSYQEVSLLASNANQEIRLPAGNLIKSVLVRTEGATTAGEPDTATINAAQLSAGLDVRLNLNGGQIRGKNNMDFGYIPDGYYILDLMNRGGPANNITELWDVSGAAEPKLILDVNGSANRKMQAVVTEFIAAVR